MPAKIARSSPRPSFGLPELLVATHISRPGFQGRRKIATIHAGLGVIRGMSILHAYRRPHNDEADDWREADSPTHAPRYAAIAETLHRFSADASVLDVGCGEAALRAWLPQDARYIGIEPSGAAVRIALERNTSANIVHTTAESFDSCGERFDSIVFNEMLYYADDPIGLLRKYAALIRQRGVILCSIYQKPGRVSLKNWLWHCLHRRRPISNVHCEKMVRAFMAREAWPILDDRAVAIPVSSSLWWHIWLAMPPSHAQESGTETGVAAG
jgi:SAM-dependent methyltransferase